VADVAGVVLAPVLGLLVVFACAASVYTSDRARALYAVTSTGPEVLPPIDLHLRETLQSLASAFSAFGLRAGLP
jgi:hypothetical protein